MLNIGIRAHDFGKLPPDELASRIAAKNLSSIQLALNKAIAGLDLKPGHLTPALAWHIGHTFAQHHIHIAVLGCYINLSHPDPAAKAPLLAYFKDHLRIARDAQCPIVGTETVSLNPDGSLHPDNHSDAAYQALVPTIADLVQTAEHFGTTVGIEGVASHVLHSPQRIHQLLNDIQSPNLQIIFDPVNLLDIHNYQHQDRLMQESFDLFADKIAIIHAKDFIPTPTGLQQVRTGASPNGLNYPLLLKLLQPKPHIPILLEEASEATAEQCIAYIREAANA